MTTSLEPVLSSPGWELLRALEATPGLSSLGAPLLGRALRDKGVDPDVVEAVLAQLELRDRAGAKFGALARSMVFTPRGLDRAPAMVVAALHAQRFRAGGATRVAVLGCGIGADALAIAGLGMGVVALDDDPDAAAAAAANLRAFPDAEVRLGEVGDVDVSDLVAAGVDAVLADPTQGTRTGDAGGPSRPGQWSPPLPLVQSWRDRIARIGVRMPLDVPIPVLPPDCHVQWTSIDGKLAEAVLWSPGLAPEGPGRSALVLRGGHAHTLEDPATAAADAPVRPAPCGPLGSMVARPDPAVLASGLLARLAEDLGARLVAPGTSLLTGDDLAPTPFATRFEVLDEGDPGPTGASAALDRPGLRDVPAGGPAASTEAPDPVREGDVTVLAASVGGRSRALFARRLPD